MRHRGVITTSAVAALFFLVAGYCTDREAFQSNLFAELFGIAVGVFLAFVFLDRVEQERRAALWNPIRMRTTSLISGRLCYIVCELYWRLTSEGYTSYSVYVKECDQTDPSDNLSAFNARVREIKKTVDTLRLADRDEGITLGTDRRLNMDGLLESVLSICEPVSVLNLRHLAAPLYFAGEDAVHLLSKLERLLYDMMTLYELGRGERSGEAEGTIDGFGEFLNHLQECYAEAAGALK